MGGSSAQQICKEKKNQTLAPSTQTLSHKVLTLFFSQKSGLINKLALFGQAIKGSVVFYGLF